jgi:PAS domain S-box-containing protein
MVRMLSTTADRPAASGRTAAAGADPEPADHDDLLLELQAELESYKAALNQQAIVAVTDRKGIITGVNDRFCQISQYTRQELIGRTHSLLNSGHHPRTFFRDMWRTIGSGEVWHEEVCNRAKDGSLYWVDTTIVPKRGSTGRISGYVSIRHDITKRKMAEAALTAENRKREQAELLLLDVIEALPNAVAAYDAEDRLVVSRCFPSTAPTRST